MILEGKQVVTLAQGSDSILCRKHIVRPHKLQKLAIRHFIDIDSELGNMHLMNIKFVVPPEPTAISDCKI